MSLLGAELPQLPTLPVRFFGRPVAADPERPNDAEEIPASAVRERIAVVSPEVAAAIPRDLGVRQVLESTWAATFDAMPMLNHERDVLVNACLRWCAEELLTDSGLVPDEAPDLTPPDAQAPKDGLALLQMRDLMSPDLDWADRVRFGDLSVGAQAVVVFLRALLKKPELLLMREPFRDMSRGLRERCEYFMQPQSRKPPDWALDLDRRVMGPRRWRSVAKRIIATMQLRPHQAVIYVTSKRGEEYFLVQDWLLLPGPEKKKAALPPQFTWHYGRIRRVAGLSLHDKRLEISYYPDNRQPAPLPAVASPPAPDAEQTAEPVGTAA